MKKENDINQWLVDIIDSSFDGIYITDGKANTLMINRAYESITGLRREEVLGRNMEDLVKEGVISKSGSLRVLKTGAPVTLHQEFKTGHRALITSSPVRDEKGQIVLIVTNVRDLTEIYNLREKVEESADERKRLLQEIDHMRSEMLKFDLVVEDPGTVRALRFADKVSDLDTSVMLLGETGVGKEVFARYICMNSTRSTRPYIKVNCGAIPEHLIESELFGYEKGSFTGADAQGHRGLFEVANGGTVFLDEIGELPLAMQVKLLRVLQEGEITRIGSTTPARVDVRVIAATNRNLEEMVQEGSFREDLYYRLMVFPIHIPPLRQRAQDIVPLILKFTADLNHKYDWNKSFSPAAIQVMESYRWPGNIRELRNVVEQAAIVATSDIIEPEHLAITRKAGKRRADHLDAVNDLPAYLKQLELRYINEAYARYGNVRDAAKSLGMSPATFVRKRKQGE